MTEIASAPSAEVVAIPSAAFYLHPDRGRHLLRFAFCKRPDVLTEAVTRLRRLKETR